MRNLAKGLLGVDIDVELDRTTLLPGRSVQCRVTVRARSGIAARGVEVALVGVEHWQYEVTVTDSEGRTRTETRTGREELRRVPVRASGPIELASGEVRTFEVELPVPPLGPASLDATVAGLAWTIDAKLDIEGGVDAATTVPVRVAQPIALLRSGAVRVGQFALFGPADVAADGVAGRLVLDPVPLVAGRPFTARLEANADRGRRLQEIRAELRVDVEATVGRGKRETVTLWTGIVATPPELAAGPTVLEFGGTIPDAALPTIELPHGRAAARMHVVLAVPWAPDPHLARDVAIATTDEL